MRYIFECKKCLKRFEAGIKIKDYGDKVKCPRCDKEMKRVLQPLRFKINGN
jgi:putative FmdB family regulatory protein